MTARITSDSGPRHTTGRRRLLRLTLAFLLCVPVLGAAACSSNDNSGCAGVTIEGQCQKKCSDSACTGGARCIIDADLNNTCAAPCQSQGDCATGRNCVTWAFPDGTQSAVCARLPYTRGGNTGQHTACTTSDQCDAMRGFSCISGKCEVACTSAADCASIGVCTPGTDDKGNKVGYCTADDKPRAPGQFGTKCPNGDECDTASDFACFGAGPGDIDAYCTARDCASDSDCPTDYRCSTERTATVPCQAACGLAGDATATGCAQAADIGAGKKFQCGPVSLLRHYCIKRSFCDECQTDADCDGTAGQICAKDDKGSKYCTVPCDENVPSCPWGTAAKCGVWDKDLGIATCEHRFGSCAGTGKSCEPCHDDADCPGGLCITAQFTGEHFCVDMSASCDCTGLPQTQGAICTGGGCPDTPGGIKMTCYGGPQEATSALYQKCVGANSNTGAFSETKTGCWPSN